MSRTLVLLVLGMACAAKAAAAPLQVDIDRDGIRDVVSITLAPARPGLELWLSTTRRITHLRTPAMLSAVVAADLDRDGWPDLVAMSASLRGFGLKVWRNAGTGVFERQRPRHRAHQPRWHTADGDRVGDQAPDPPSSVSPGTFRDAGSPAELSYLPFCSTSMDCTMWVQRMTLSSSHAPPQSPRAPPTPLHA